MCDKKRIAATDVGCNRDNIWRVLAQVCSRDLYIIESNHDETKLHSVDVPNERLEMHP